VHTVVRADHLQNSVDCGENFTEPELATAIRSVKNTRRLLMKKLFYFFLLASACSSRFAMGQAENPANISMGGIEYQFICEGREGASHITVAKKLLTISAKLWFSKKIWSRRMTAAWEPGL
jgi:hypothetical protein